MKKIIEKIKKKLDNLITRTKDIRWQDIKTSIKNFYKQFIKISSFVLLLNLYMFHKMIMKFENTKLMKLSIMAKLGKLMNKLNNLVNLLMSRLDRKNTETIKRSQLIEISIRNMRAKKTRTLVTIGGMTIGIAIIVFLVSVGYGLEKMVVSRVARLDEMMQTDVSSQANALVKINDKTLSDFSQIAKVDKVLPLIAVVGRVNYQNSVSDMPVYGVTGDYLLRSAVKPTKGKIFTSNDLSTRVGQVLPKVAGATTEAQNIVYGQNAGEVEFTLNPGAWVAVYEEPKKSSKLLGFTKRFEGKSMGSEVWGGKYTSNYPDQDYDRWITSQFYLWNKLNCKVVSCRVSEYESQVDPSGFQIFNQGYVREENAVITARISYPKVLGLETESTDSATLIAEENSIATTSAELTDLEILDIASEAGILKEQEVNHVDVSDKAKKQAVVNRAVLNILNLNEDEAVGKTFSVSFIVTGDLLEDSNQKIESNPSDYTIVAVTPDDTTPFFYIPFIDLRSLGVTNYSQAKVIVNDKGDLEKVRTQIEAMGYTTNSVVDTVNQITSLFATVRRVLAIVGFVALIVAGLGMFNTLTVSLLERTREVGLMKAMGMKSEEVKELFLTESMIMGFFGGIIGIFVGFLVGKIVSLIISALAIFKGVGFVDIAFIPFGFFVIVVVISLAVGVVTGMYPAKRASKISALNALRYE